MKTNNTTIEVEEQVAAEINEAADFNRWSIIVFNDDNTFENVIVSFIEVLNYQLVQAEQLATTIHFVGKARVKTGSFEELQPLERALTLRNLTTTLEEI
jgi:ATP-dependent Clp protease adaptor protein ClpS